MTKSAQLCSGTNPIYSDARGFFQELWHVNADESVAQVSWFSIAPNTWRGCHYHLETVETFILLDGECYFLEQGHSISGAHIVHMDQPSIAVKSHILRTHGFFSRTGAKVLVLSNRHFNKNDTDTFVSKRYNDELQQALACLEP